MNKIIELEPLPTEDSTGKRYTVHVYQDMIKTSGLDNSNSFVGGLLSYRLSDGSAVNRISDTEFEIVKNGTKITRL